MSPPAPVRSIQEAIRDDAVTNQRDAPPPGPDGFALLPRPTTDAGNPTGNQEVRTGILPRIRRNSCQVSAMTPRSSNDNNNSQTEWVCAYRYNW